MAAGLNPPSKYTQEKGSNKNMDLLPPSAFESKRSGDPWKELARTTGELIHLRLENQQLRQEKVPLQPAFKINEEIRARVDVHKSPPDKDTTRHLDELIQRQAAEIAQLKQELRTLTADHKQEVAGLEKEIVLKERQHMQTISSLETELKTRGDNYEYQVDRLSSAHQEEMEELSAHVDRLDSQLQDTQRSLGGKVTTLQLQLQEVTETSQRREEELSGSLREKNETISKLENQVSSLKKYIGESERGPLPAELWKREKDGFEKQQKDLTAEKESLLSTVELLNIRLSAVSDILTLQEKELSKAKTESVDKNRLEPLLLTRWREKVYSLLVQQKSADIVSKKDFQNWKEKLRLTEADLGSSKTQVEVLTCALSDRDAQLEIERNNNKLMQEDLTNAQQIAIALDDQLTDRNQQIEGLKRALSHFSGSFLESVTSTQGCMDTLKTYGQRITFATGRLEMLQAQFARKEAHLRVQIEEGRKTPAERDLPPEQPQYSPASHLQEELEAVTRERDTLAAQIREDSLMMEARMASCRQEVECEMRDLKSSVIELNTCLQQRSETCSSLTDQVVSLERELEETRERLESMTTELGKQQVTHQQALKTQEDDLQTGFTERVADMERKVNEAKREHAKTVVSIRQAQRQSARDKERNEETARIREEHYSRQIEALQQQLRAVEKERNLMMTTLRQEGLLGRVKSQREEPVLLEEPSELLQDAAPPTCTDEAMRTGAVVPEEPLSAVLEDLESLTAVVMGQDDGDTDSDLSDHTN